MNKLEQNSSERLSTSIYFKRKDVADIAYIDNPVINSFASALFYQSIKRIKKIINQSLKYKNDNSKQINEKVDLTDKLPIEIYYSDKNNTAIIDELKLKNNSDFDKISSTVVLLVPAHTKYLFVENGWLKSSDCHVEYNDEISDYVFEDIPVVNKIVKLSKSLVKQIDEQKCFPIFVISKDNRMIQIN